MSDINDLLGFALEKNPVDFANAFDDIIRDKAASALENHKIELAKAIYGGSEDDIDSYDNGVDDSDLDADDIETDDEFDIDDIDLEDLDLEDLEDITDDQEDA